MRLWPLLVIFAPVSIQAGGLTLLAPSSVFEGDSVVLTCQKEKKWGIKMMTYYKDEKKLFSSEKDSSFPIHNAVFSDSGDYYCTITFGLFWTDKKSPVIKIQVQELFPSPVLIASSFRPTEGGPMTLSCETRLPPQRSYVQLQFRFFRDGRVLRSGWRSSSELHVSAVWTEDSGSYQCEASAVSLGVRKQSRPAQIRVQRVPVSKVSLETRVPAGQVIEGGKLVLLCSVAEGTGNITFFWYREAAEISLERKTQSSLSAELEIPAVKESDAGEYYCKAHNGHDPVQSKVVNILVRIPVSRPLLILRGAGAQAVEGDVVELRCEALRGSPPILYQLYHENVILGNSSAPSGGGVSFNLSLTAEHSGNYSCEANNGLGAQRSETVSLSISGAVGDGRNLVTVGVLGGLFGVLGIIGFTLLFYCWSHKISGESFSAKAPRGASPNPQAPPGSSPLSAMEELQPMYANVGPVCEDVLYSEIWSGQQPEGPANTRRIFLENKDFQVIYSSVKKP